MLGQRLQELAAQNPAAITEIIRPQPVFANGQQRGYRVYPGRNRQQFSKLGLMPGDLVTAINGTPLDDPARGMEILQSIEQRGPGHGDGGAQRPEFAGQHQQRPGRGRGGRRRGVA